MSGSVLPAGAGRDANGRLAIGGCAVAELLGAVGTPAMLVEEDDLRSTARAYTGAFPSNDERPSVYFASKAFPCPGIIQVFPDEGLGCDVASEGELALALAEGALLATPEVGDTIIVPVTGAYCYSTQNNYNGACRPPVVLCKDGRARVIVRRETIDDLLLRTCDVAVALPEPA